MDFTKLNQKLQNLLYVANETEKKYNDIYMFNTVYQMLFFYSCKKLQNYGNLECSRQNLQNHRIMKALIYGCDTELGKFMAVFSFGVTPFWKAILLQTEA